VVIMPLLTLYTKDLPADRHGASRGESAGRV